MFAAPVFRLSPGSIRLTFRAESGAKVNHFFRTTKSFSRFFQKFSEPFVCRFEPYFLFEAGAKVSHFSESPKDFRTFFQNFSERFREAKSKGRMNEDYAERRKRLF